MRTRLFALLSLFAASCQSEMPSIKKSEFVIVALLLATGLLLTARSRLSLGETVSQ